MRAGMPRGLAGGVRGAHALSQAVARWRRQAGCPARRYRVAMPGWPDHEVRCPSPRLWRIRCAEVIAAGAAVAVVAGTVAGLTLGAGAAVIAVAVAITGSLAALWFARNRFRSWVYQERDEDLIVERGVLIRRLSVVPYGRMQFVDVS